MNENSLSKGTNKNSNTKYWIFNKSERLDNLITMWNEIKHKY